MDVRKAHRIRGCSRSNMHRRLKLYMHEYLHSIENKNSLEQDVAVPSTSVTGTEQLAIVPNDIHIPSNTVVDVSDIQVPSASDYQPPRCAFVDSTDEPQIAVIPNDDDEWVSEDECHEIDTDSGNVPNLGMLNAKGDVTKAIRRYAISANLTLKQVNMLLRTLRPFHPELPLDARTLLRTPRHAKTKFIAGGQYIHFGLETSIKRKRKPKVLSDYTDEKENTPPKCKFSVDVDHSPPPPVLEDMSIDLQTSPIANSSWMHQAPKSNATSEATVSPVAGCSRWPFASWTQKHRTIDEGDQGALSFKACSSPITSGASIPSTSNTRGTKFVHRSSSPIAGSAMTLSTMSADIAQMRVEIAQGFQKMLNALERNTKALNALRHTIVAQHNMLEMQLPVTFPMRTIEQWNLLSSRLYEDDAMNARLISHINKTGGNSFGECTRNILRCLIADELTPHINWRGTNNKVPIRANPITKAIIESVMLHKFPGATRSGIEEQIQQWIQKSRRRVDSHENVVVVVSDDM